MRLLLHACCGPCLIEPFEALAAQHDVTVYYLNPNIHPRSEYELRRDTLLGWAAARGIRVVEGAYEPQEWERVTAGIQEDPGARCKACWSLRMSETARFAAAEGFEGFTTTLTVSPYQDPEGVTDAGNAAAEESGVPYLACDFRDRYPSATRRSRDAGMYRQNYCGCEPSRVEAQEQRAARSEARRR